LRSPTICAIFIRGAGDAEERGEAVVVGQLRKKLIKISAKWCIR